MNQILVLQDLGISSLKLNDLLSTLSIKNQLIHGFSDVNLIDEKVQIIITIKEKVDEKLLKRFPNTQLVAVAFTGYDVIDLNYCKQKNISVCNVPSYATDAVAELTIGLAISLLRDIPKTNLIIRNNGWNFAPGRELRGKKVGIVGTGTIGLRVAELFKVFGCEIFAWSRSKNQDFINLGGIYIDHLNELCSKVDILSIHTPLNSATKNLIDEEQLHQMKPTAFIINTARGPIINEIALTNALNEHKIAGAAIDVFEVEPILSENLLLQTENSILTPHPKEFERLAGISANSYARLQLQLQFSA
ncbi:MAG: NAD(P)-dependent oxidoreductase, partial [Flavobacteriaceae bacterium]|nr:NAD(P)-dependent oxidoreductase [Flavobacteriaceae bacterium]